LKQFEHASSEAIAVDRRLMLSGIINAACDGDTAHPPESEYINNALAAVTGIGARDEPEGMLATQMVATHFAEAIAQRRVLAELIRLSRATLADLVNCGEDLSARGGGSQDTYRFAFNPKLRAESPMQQ
jgi:hypothetical protein